VNGAHERPAIAHSGIDVDILPSDNVVLVEHAGAYVRNSWVEDYIAATEERVMRMTQRSSRGAHLLCGKHSVGHNLCSRGRRIESGVARFEISLPTTPTSASSR